MRYLRYKLLSLALLAVCTALAPSADAQSAWREDFESPTTSWAVAESDAPHRIEKHERSSSAAHFGAWSEHVQFTAGHGATLYFEHRTPPFRLIDELRPSLWVACERPGIQILARLAFPRAVDEATGRPITCLVRGASSRGDGKWQNLSVDDLPVLVARQAQLLRSRLGRDIDTRGAYLHSVVLNMYAGEGRTDVWIDDLEIQGAVDNGGVVPAAYIERPSGVASGDDASAAGRVRMRGPVLLVDNRPFLPRMIEYQGESLRFLQERGFNALRLATPPSEQFASEAAALGLWIVSPPPPTGDAAMNMDAAGETIGEVYDPVLAWDLGHNLAVGDLDRTSQLADEVRRADRFRARPLVCSPVADLRSYSRLVGAIVAERSPLGTSLELADYGTWLRERPRLLAPGTPLWASIQTQLDPLLLEQQSLFTGKDQRRAGVEPEQIRMLVFQALAAGARGFSFRSSSPLDYQDQATRTRAKALESLNLELEIIEPFVAAGQLSAISVSGNRELTAAVLQTENARLLIPIWCGAGAQFVPGQSAGNEISFTVPGVPASHEPYELTPAGLNAIRKQRVTGGTRVTLDEFGVTSLILLTGDPRVLSAITTGIQRSRAQAAKLSVDLALEKLSLVDQIDRTLTVNAQAVTSAEDWRVVSRRIIEQAELRLVAQDYKTAYILAHRSTRALRLIERSHWEAAVAKLGTPASSPLAVGFATLPEHWRMVETLNGVQPGRNQLNGGNFENLDALVSGGWEHIQHAENGVKTVVELAPQAARSGKLGLRLRATAADPKSPPAMIESPPVWISAPPVPFAPGTWVRIHGWLKVASPIVGSVDGLMIGDSLGGPALAERIGATRGWREFTLYRVVSDSGSVAATFALSGLGEVHLDDVTVEPLGGAGRTTGYPSTGQLYPTTSR
ncbi:MAG: hypothetical protein SGJ19_03235 [Planctomycetia bacterium]|nr:hypothetical protein [Planctomycetia bacterium]